MSKAALDAIRTQVMWNRLIAVVEEQAQSLLRTAFGTIQPSGPNSLAAHISPLRAGCPKAVRSPSSNDGCAITTDS